ncbi:MAG TPA: hypothetical protein VMU59_14140 [Caulobacteraceae bacterium]|nr:hypothetical protein [Caulobacteraceae bacterium]
MAPSVDVMALAGVALTALGLVIQAALFAFHLGKLSARVEGLEARARQGEDSGAALAAITATLQALKASVDEIKTTFARRFEQVEDSVTHLMLRARPRRGAAGD